MKIEQSFTINGKIVDKTSRQLAQFDIYMEDNDSEMELFFVNRTTGEVQYSMTISADCGQNVGYINDWNVKKLQG